MKSAPIKILLIDDDVDCHDLIRDMLIQSRESEYHLECCSDYHQAREAVTQNQYHACLIDYRLGPKTGLDFIRETRQLNDSPPMIVLTGYDDPNLASESIRTGAKDFLLKVHITPELLDQSIRHAIEYKQSEQQTRLMQFSIDHAADMIFWIGPEGRFVYVNDTVCKTLGYSREQLLAMTVFDIDKNYPRQRWQEHWLQLRQCGSISFESEHSTQNGKTIPVQINANFINYGDHEFNCAFARDISEYKQVQQRLTQALKRFEAVFMNVPMVAIQGFDPEGVIRHWNKYSELFFGLTAGEAVGHRFQDIILDEQQGQEFSGLLKQIMKTHEPITPREMKIHSIHDHVRWMYSVAFPILENDQVVEIIGMSVDITELKYAQKEIQLAKEQSEYINRQLETSIEQANILAREANVSNESKSAFLANMSHEIRTPLHAIIGFSDILAEESITPEQKNYVHLIQTAGQNLLELINDILDFSKIEAGKLETEIIDCSLDKILQKIQSLMEPAAKKKNLDFQIITDSQVPPVIRTDPTRMRQCLVNLVSNAIKFTQQGYVRLHTRIEQDTDQTWVCFDVEDTGIGVSTQAQEKIFEMFSQADEGVSRKFGGTGLGLSITKKLAAILGGSVTLDSQPEKGSTFYFKIPAGVDVDLQTNFQPSHSLISSVHKNISTVSGRYRGHILVAEDNTSNQLLMHKLLQKMGLKVTLADNGEHAVEKALKGNFDMILMDIQMPRINGYDATRMLRDKKVTLPIIALTAGAMKGDREQCLQAGCDNYLTKPINVKELRKIMDKYLNNDPSGAVEGNSLNPADSAASTPVQDNSLIISELADDPDLREVAEMFIQELPETLENVRQAAIQNDYDQLKFLIHSLKGASGSAGFPDLMEKARQVESHIVQNEIDSLQKELDELNALFGRARSGID